MMDWKTLCQKITEHQIKQHHNMAKSGMHPDFKRLHPDWVRDGQQNKFTVMDKKLREDSQKKMDEYFARIKRLHVGK